MGDCWLCGYPISKVMAYGREKYLGHIVHSSCVEKHLQGKAVLKDSVEKMANKERRLHND